MKIAHLALWTQQLDVQARFWVDFFAASINEKYLSQTNPGFAPILLLSTRGGDRADDQAWPAAGQRG